MERKTLWESYSDEQFKEMNKVTDDYKYCLDHGKTERECVTLAIEKAKAAGYVNIEECIAENRSLMAGDKVYAVYNGKLIVLYHIGTNPIEEGMNILGAHIDSPRLDIKQNPLYEKEGFSYLDTHYYGGIKKYQWVTIPLAIHGVFAKKDGSVVNVNIGEDENDPVFTVTDLLIHLAGNQMSKKANVVVEGENLDLLVGSATLNSEEKDQIKANTMRLVSEKYGVDEEDFLSAELEIVPADKARDLGFDRSMILAYGQDDKICAWTSLFAMLDIDTPARTACTLLVDKEEIGSVGASGMHSHFFENTTAELLNLMGLSSDLAVRRTISRSKMLSSDVSAGYDPLYADAFEKKNAAFLGKGIVFNKFTGSRGKSGSNDANAEYMASIRRVMDDNNVQFQTAELGKVDVGGGGTIAYIMANYGMEVIDAGLAILCMHSPQEVSSKVDVYEAVRAYKAFLNDMD
ncbi:MAG TPA: aminopeptidase [Erysipelotrichaceae bacterium]|jgi:aspartyl aminopeptidase|nr:aminopeptidase [Erysipelotrichaceae bacterium]